jgi:hypothetical protein
LENNMASSSRATGSGSTRKVAWLAFAVVLAVVLYSAGWFYAAGRLEASLGARLEASRDRAVSASCPGLEVRGFPFRIGVFCTSVGFDDQASGTSGNFGALRSAAQVYRPGHAVVELDGPAQVRISPDIALVADWSLLHASGVAWLDGLDRASLAYDDLKGRFNAPAAEVSLGFSAGHGEVHVRQDGEALDVASSATGLVLDLDGRAMPSLDVSVDLTLVDAARWISVEGPPANAPLGVRGELRRLSLDLGNGQVASLSGPMRIDEDGYLSGTFDLDVRGISAWRDRISEAFPEVSKNVGRIAEVIRGLGGGEQAVVKLTVTDGTVYLGLFPIAFIPPV